MEVERLREAVRARDDLLAAAGHELRNPLNAMVLFAEVAQHDVRRARGEPAALDRAAERLGALVRQVRRFARRAAVLLDVTQLTTGRLQLDVAAVDLGALVGRLLDDLEPLAAASGCALERALEPGVVGVWDALRVEQVVDNLVTNALKFGQGRPVRVRVALRGADARVEVEDAGPGIAPEDRARMFERFERGLDAERGRRGGFGVGLWIVNQLVLAMDGRVEVHGAPGVGSTFVVSLPLEERRA